MRRLLLVLCVALVAVACGTSEPVAVEPVAAEPAAEEQASPVADGRAALAAAEGEPHVLWFWGAH